MSVTARLVGSRHTVWALALAAAAFGTLSYLALQVQLFPDTSPPVVTVVTSWPGASGEDVADEVSRPLEEEIGGVEGIVSIGSSSQDDLSVVTAEFHYEREVDLAAVDAQNAVARIRGRLPRGIAEPRVLKVSSSDTPVISVGVATDEPVRARRVAEDVLAPRLQRIRGVAAVDVFGGARDAVLVDLDRSRVEALRLPPARVVDAVRGFDVAAPAGSLRTERTRTSLRVETRAADLQALADLPVPLPGGTRVRLGDLGTVRRGALDDDARFAIDGERAIAMQVYKSEDANTVEVVRRVTAALDDLGAEHPGVRLLVGDESASFTEQSVDNLLDNVWQALLLASVIIFLFIGRVRASGVAVVSMPLSYGITFALMRATDTDLDMVTLSAVILAVGMVVDASVVILENVSRRRDEDGLDAEEAAVAGTDEVRPAVLAGAATTVVVLLPLLFLGGFVGRTFAPLARTLLFAFLASVTVALVLVPVLSIYTGGRSRVDAVGAWLVTPFRWSMDRLRDGYLLVLRGALRQRLLTVIVATGLLVGGAALLRAQGAEVLPRMDGGSFFVSLETPSGSSLAETERVVREVEALLAAEREVVRVQSQVGFEPGMKVSSTTGAQGPTQAFLTVTLTPRTDRTDTIWDVEARVREGLARIPGIRAATVRELGNTAKSTTSAPVVVRLSGPDALVLDRLGERVLERIAEVPSVVEPVRSWRIDQRRVRVDVDELRAAGLGLSPLAVAREMRAGTDGTPAGTYHGDAGTSPPIMVRWDRAKASEPADLLDRPVFPEGGESVPLRALASLHPTTGQALVTREDHLPSLEVSAFVGERALSFVLGDVADAVAGLQLPRGYEAVLEGEREDLAEAQAELGGALGVSLLAVYLLLVAQLRSFVHPLVIMGSVPLSLVGVGVALALADKPVSMPVMVGFILLAGTVVNNAILLVEFVRQARDAGAPRREALLDSVRTRFRPVMMTALSTIVGMIPLAAEWALGAERFSPLAVAVIGGLTAATILILVFIPVLYDLVEDAGASLARLRRRLLPAPRAAALVIVTLAGSLALPAPSRAADAPLRLDLETAQRMAREHSHALEAREAEIGAAESRERQARGRLLPRVDVEGRYSRLKHVEPGTLPVPSPEDQDTPPVRFGEAIDQTWSARATVTQPLFRGMSLLRSRDAANLGVSLARTSRQAERDDLRLRVTESYFGLVRASRLQEVARRSVDLLEAHFERVKALRRAGRATALEASRARSRLAEARGRLETARGGTHVAEVRLAVLLGVEAGASIVPVDGPEVIRRPSSDAPSLTEEALRERSALRSARTAARLGERRAEAAEGALWPSVLMRAGYTVANPNDRYVPPRTETHDSWDVSLVLSWTAWDWGVRRHEVRAAEREAAAAKSRAAALEDATRVEVARSLTELRTARSRLEAALEGAEAAEEAHAAAARLFEAGRLPGTEVLESEVDLTRARASVVEAQIEERLALARLRRLLGRR
ncbi:MAG: efflux RND transporter permease subunit [Myxococcota bacterium]